MERGVDDCRKAVNFLKTARGQMDGIVKMLEDDRGCVDVSKQILAAIALLRKANSTILKQYFQDHLAEAVKNGCQEEILPDLMKVLDSYLDK